MMRRFALGAVVCLLAAVAGAEPVTTIRNNGNPTNRLDIAVLGDGYTAAEIANGKYALDVEAAISGLFAQEPFGEYRNYFNVHRIDVTSAESGADHPSIGVFKTTALDAAFDCQGITRLICVNVTKVNAVLTSSIASPAAREAILVIVNDSQYGGSGGSVAVASTNSASVEIVLHEIGHSLGLLADEYGGPPPPVCVNTVEPAAANATRNTVRSQIKWNAWIDPATPVPTGGTVDGIPGLYQGAQYCDVGLYRPTFNSKMRFLGVPFYQINTEQLIKRFHNYVAPIDEATPLSSSIFVPSGSSKQFTVTTPHPVSHALSISWRLDGALVGSGAAYVINGSVGKGSHTLQLVVLDPTPMVRNDPANVLRATRTWTVTVSGGSLGDFDGDGKADTTVFRPSNGTWYIRNSATGLDQGLLWGGAGDVPVVGDYDGDGLSDMAVFRPSNGTWYVRQSSTGGLVASVWGGVGDVPVQGDYDGDGRTDIAVFRASSGVWYIRNSLTGLDQGLLWGGAGDVPAPGDYDADGKTDMAVFRASNGTWYIRPSSTGVLVASVWGGVGDIAVSGDYDGDGRTDIAVFRASSGIWYIRNSNTGLDEGLLWGGAGDVPVPGDYDGDGKTDMAVFRPSNGTWYLRSSTTGALTTVVWGGASDIPVLRRQ